MAPLKSLEPDYPIIDSNFQQFCASHHIFSVEDFLLHDIYALELSTKQHFDSKRLEEGISVVRTIMEGLHQPWLNGMELLQKAQGNKHGISTGYERIDVLLEGGLFQGNLVELVGPSSSGKTQLCLKVAANVAVNNLGSVTFFDTGNSFSPKRIDKLLDQSSEPAKIKTEEVRRRVMDKIVCQSVFDIYVLFDLLHQLKSTLKPVTGSSVQMLIVDSISSLVTPILGSGAHGHALMVSLGFLLKELAYEHNLSVLVTNHMVGAEGGHLKPALGESWKNVPDMRLHVSRDYCRKSCDVFLKMIDLVSVLPQGFRLSGLKSHDTAKQGLRELNKKTGGLKSLSG
ncbi:DNA repair protein RAD51 homolog 4 isoform X2 [Daucus carota subsp. sativus]|uniref:DNA repair protein RAD51 homolog 4 isoform X2 n=1 Tax=Daucus carota subsp. sativus TaxID=79200 RepID=UPI0007EFBC74|nr:PREDICTED: DNA repair protein RAD51 homolog 4 isoform X3 [Daucus carota subsp. sativus]